MVSAAKLRSQFLGQRSQPLGFGGGNIDAQLLFSVRNRGLHPRNLFFEKCAPVFHLLLLDGIQAAGARRRRRCGAIRLLEAAFDDDSCSSSRGFFRAGPFGLSRQGSGAACASFLRR